MCWGSNSGYNSIDGEKAHFNNDQPSSWSGAAFAKFSFTLPAGESITSATLNWRGTSSKGYGSYLYYLNVGQTFDFSAPAEEGTIAQYTGNKTLISNNIVSLQGGVSVETDVTDAVRAVVTGEQNYIIFQWTANQGGADLYGKGSTNAPTLTIVTESASTVTSYTVKFVDSTTGNDLKTAVVHEGELVGASASASDEEKASFTIGDSKYLYVAEGSTTSIKSLSSTASENIITLKFREAETFTYTVNAVDASNNILAQIATGSIKEDETKTVYYTMAVTYGGKWYKTGIKNAEPYYGIVISSTVNGTQNITFAETTDFDYFVEGNDLSTNKSYAAGTGVAGRMSSGNASRMAKGQYVYTSPLEGGVYNITIRVRNQRGAASTETFECLKVRDGEGTTTNLLQNFDVWSNGTLETRTITNVEIPDGYAFQIDANGSSNSNLEIDYLTFKKLVVTTAAIPTSGYGTIASDYALDCSNLPSGLKAYKVSSISASAVTLQEVTTAVAAGTGLILKGTASTAYDIPVVASGTDISSTNKLKAAVTATDIAANEAYILQNGEFHLVTAASSIPAGKAYLLASDITGGGARSLNFTFDATAIKAVEGEIQNGEFYNVAGQRVAVPTKGLYIVNGKKIVVK